MKARAAPCLRAALASPRGTLRCAVYFVQDLQQQQSWEPGIFLVSRSGFGTRVQPPRMRSSRSESEGLGYFHDYLLRLRPFLRIRGRSVVRARVGARPEARPQLLPLVAPPRTPLPRTHFGGAADARAVRATSTSACLRQRGPAPSRGGPAFPLRPRRPQVLWLRSRR
ncbi:unnamed protein product [Rangifer tarandus platyrhynchus]|uniref:Uncharacterized protein n=1 Tax=Rangifer tarandus platyrhynchus TaxID=3082113 RepID=A0AC59YK38_RANTA